MSWHGIEGHDPIVEQFRRALARGRLASTFLFVGPSGIGKRTFALRLAQALLCSARPEDQLDPCGRCDSCVQVDAGTHPDLLRVAKPPDKSDIPLKLFIGEDDRRMREGLCHDIALKPFFGGRKVAIIDDADYLNEEGANCLLKTLEEPPPRSVMILIGTRPDRQLPTIRSRSQIIRFQPLQREVVARLLLAQGLVDDPAEARRMAEFSEGSVEHALELADRDLWAFRAQLFERLAESRFDSVAFGKALGAFVDAAGKEAVDRRNRARQVFGFAAEFFRQLLRALAGLEAEGDAEINRAVTQRIATGQRDQETAAACLDRTLEALTHIDRNANQANYLECWADDLARIAATGQPCLVGA